MIEREHQVPREAHATLFSVCYVRPIEIHRELMTAAADLVDGIATAPDAETPAIR
jgi:hypothetical protein